MELSKRENTILLKRLKEKDLNNSRERNIEL